MTCEQARPEIAERLAGAATPELDEHLAVCDTCRQEASQIEQAWDRLGMFDAPEPSPRLRGRFYDALEQERRRLIRRPIPATWLAAAACLLVGLGIGFLVGRPSSEQQEMARMRGELAGLRQAMALTLMQNPSAPDRLRGVSFSSQHLENDPQVVDALLDRLNYDPNTNVRLAVVDALEKQEHEQRVREGIRNSLARQRSPLVQLALIELFAGWRGDPAAAAALRRVAFDPQANPTVRQRATLILKSLEQQ